MVTRRGGFVGRKYIRDVEVGGNRVLETNGVLLAITVHWITITNGREKVFGTHLLIRTRGSGERGSMLRFES